MPYWVVSFLDVSLWWSTLINALFEICFGWEFDFWFGDFGIIFWLNFEILSACFNDHGYWEDDGDNFR